MAHYEIDMLNSHIIYIRWQSNPLRDEAYRFVDDLNALLDNADAPMYFISDLRKGRIIDIRAIHLLSDLTTHKNWAGSTAFSENPLSKLFTTTFRKGIFNGIERNTFFEKPEEAISFMVELAPDAVAGIDWSQVVS